MRAVLERQGLGPSHVLERQVAIEMGKERATARGFPFERIPEPVGLETEEKEAVLACEMLGGGFFNLLGSGEMDEPVGDIDRRALCLA